MKYKIQIIGAQVFLGISVLSMGMVRAFNGDTGLGTTGKAAGLSGGETDLATVVGNVVNAFLGLSGLVLMIVVIYGGIRYMIAGGNEEEVKKAKQWIINGIIGLIIISLAFALSSFVLSQLITASSGSGPAAPTP